MSQLWIDVILTLIGAGLLQVGIIGMIKGGELPLVKVPEHLRGEVRAVLGVFIALGLIMVTGWGKPDLVEAVFNHIFSA